MAEARTRQLTVAVRETDARMLREEAHKLGISVSRYAYCRLMTPTQKPLPHYDCMSLAGSLGRIGGLLNQIARVAHADGFNTESFCTALALTQEVQRLLWGLRC